jgi:hypothetical protein
MAQIVRTAGTASTWSWTGCRVAGSTGKVAGRPQALLAQTSPVSPPLVPVSAFLFLESVQQVDGHLAGNALDVTPRVRRPRRGTR